MGQQRIVDGSLVAQALNGTLQIHGIPEDDGGHDQIQITIDKLLVLLGSRCPVRAHQCCNRAGAVTN